MHSPSDTRSPRGDGRARTAPRRLSQADKAQKIAAVLERLYPEPAIPLQHEDPFTLLVSVVLSAQTTDKKVNQVTPGLFALAKTPAEMARCSEEQIRMAIREVGLAPQKAKALRKTAEILAERYDGRVPETFDALVELPGVGRKTANVVLAQAFNQPAFPVDTHIHRLAGRWGLSRAKTAEGAEADLCRIFPRALWSKLHLQMIYFGREYCPALRHDLTACPICAWAASKIRIREEMRSRSTGPQRRET